MQFHRKNLIEIFFTGVSCTNLTKLPHYSQNTIVLWNTWIDAFKSNAFCKLFIRKQVKSIFNELKFEMFDLNDSSNYGGIYYEEIYFEFWYFYLKVINFVKFWKCAKKYYEIRKFKKKNLN